MQPQNSIAITPVMGSMGSVGSNITGMVMDADTEKIAFKFWPTTTSAITDVDVLVFVSGTITDTNFKVQIETDSSDAPSGTVLGATNNAISAEWAGPAATGWTGLKTLSENTGTLSLNTPYWIVIFRSSGGSLSASDSMQLRGAYSSQGLGFGQRCRHYNGTNWTTTTVQNANVCFVVKHQDGTYSGVPLQAGPSGLSAYQTSPVATDIYGSNKQGIRFSVGCKCKVAGLHLAITKNGTPNDLVCTLYEGSTQKAQETITASKIVSGPWFNITFSSTPEIAAGSDIYIVFSQASSGGSDSSDYDLYATQVPTTYQACYPSKYRCVFGTSSDPTSLTVSTVMTPSYIMPILAPESDLLAGGSGAFSATF